MGIAIAITSVLLLVVFVALLGTMREVVVLQGKVTGLTDLLLKPPSPQFFDGMLPDLAREKLMRARPAEAVDSFFLVFVRQGCSGCARLLQEIKAGIADNGLDARRFTCVISGRSGGLDKALRTTGIHIITDSDNHLEEACTGETDSHRSAPRLRFP